jgi:hypothetical protein
MGLLFLFAGYFIPGSLERKGARRFVNDRLFRLGVPVLVFMFILHPLCVALSNPGTGILRYIIRGIANLDFVSWSGPLWFAFALLIFTLAYVLKRTLFGAGPVKGGVTFRVRSVLLIILLITAAAFGLRLVFPLGTDVINFQLGYFASYLVLFAIGVGAHRSGVLERIDLRRGRRWLVVSFAVGLPLWALVVGFGGPVQGNLDLINGGLRWQAAAFAFWESFFCVAVIIGLVGVFRERFNEGRPWARFLSEQAFGVYVFHAPVLIAVTMALRGFRLHPLPKFVLVSVVALPACFVVSWSIRRVGFLGKLFS